MSLNSSLTPPRGTRRLSCCVYRQTCQRRIQNIDEKPHREVNALLAVHEVAVLLIAWVGIDGAAAAAENVVLVGGGGVGSG